MEIKEVEKLLGIPRSNIRFYEREGLLYPQREGNNYRTYSNHNIDMLKKIIILRKLGFTVEEIKKLQTGEKNLEDLAKYNNCRLEKQLIELKTALKLSHHISQNGEDFNTLNTEEYWQIIRTSEKNGEKFVDIYKDCVMFESEVFNTMWKYVFFHDFQNSKNNYGLLKAGLILFLICIIRGLGKLLWKTGSFSEGFLYPFILFAIASAILLPIHLISKKSPRVAKILITTISVIGLLFLLTILGILLFGGFSFFVDWLHTK